MNATINLKAIGFFDSKYRYEVVSLKNTLRNRPGDILFENEVQGMITSKKYTINIKGAK